MKNDQYTTKQVLVRLLTDHIKPYWIQISIAAAFMVIGALCAAAIVKLVQPAIDDVLLTHNKKMLVFVPIAIILVHLIKGIAEFFQNYLVKFIGQRILTDLQIRMYKHLLFADLSFIQSQSSGRLISRFTNDISLLRGSIANLFTGFAKHFLTVLFLIGLMFKLEPSLSLIAFFAFPGALYPVQKLGKRLRKVSNKTQEELGNYTARLDETFQSIKVVKAFVGEKFEIKRVQEITENIITFYKRSAILDAFTSPITEIFSGITVAGVFWYGAYLIINGSTTPGTLFSFSAAFISAYRPFKSLLGLNVNLQDGIAAAKRVFCVLDMTPSIKEDLSAPKVIFDNTEIVFNNTMLAFDQKIALNLEYLKIKSGEITAIVGKSGSGKTSLANLLVRFYDPAFGNVFINGYDIKNIRLSCLRKQIALITQDTILFDATIAENIAYGIENANLEDIIKAAKFADAHEFISSLPQGYDTMIGNQGCSLSGGQRQRLSIARAFLKNASILVLDEATSNLDVNSEHHILESVLKLRRNRTTLIITHRLANTKMADNIIVMKSGTILEQGTFTELLNSKGEYYRLFNKEKSKGEYI